MKKKLTLALITGVFLLGLAGIVQANLVVYHNLNNFIANAGATTIYNFDADTMGYIKFPSYGRNENARHDFGDFTIDATGRNIYLTEICGQDGDQHIFMNTSGNKASVKVLFDFDITAFGFNYKAGGNDGWDHSTFTYNNTTYDLGTPGDSGFFGLIEDCGRFAAGTSFSFGQNSINWSNMSFDDIIYSLNSPSPVPIPDSILLFGISLIGLIGIRKK